METLTSEQAVTHIDDLMQLLTDGSLAVRLAAQNSLLNAGAAAIEPLLAMLAEGGPHIAEAMEVAADLPDPRLVAALTSYATAEDAHQREMAARALGSGTGVGAVQVLGGLLEDESPDVRANAIGGLLRLESHESVVAIGRCLSDPAWHVRRRPATPWTGSVRRASWSCDEPQSGGPLRQGHGPPGPRWIDGSERAPERIGQVVGAHRSCLIPSSLHCPTSSPDGSRR